MNATAVRRTIEVVPPLLIGLLTEAGKLPRAPFAPTPGGLGFRRPGIAEVSALTWMVEWPGEKVDGMDFNRASGCAGFQDRYDFHRASDVREICYVSGSRRAVVNLVRWIQNDARENGRRCIGSLDSENAAMSGAIKAMGGKKTRVVVFEDGGVSFPA